MQTEKRFLYPNEKNIEKSNQIIINLALDLIQVKLHKI